MNLYLTRVWKRCVGAVMCFACLGMHGQAAAQEVTPEFLMEMNEGAARLLDGTAYTVTCFKRAPGETRLSQSSTASVAIDGKRVRVQASRPDGGLKGAGDTECVLITADSTLFWPGDTYTVYEYLGDGSGQMVSAGNALTDAQWSRDVRNYISGTAGMPLKEYISKFSTPPKLSASKSEKEPGVFLLRIEPVAPGSMSMVFELDGNLQFAIRRVQSLRTDGTLAADCAIRFQRIAAEGRDDIVFPTKFIQRFYSANGKEANSEREYSVSEVRAINEDESERLFSLASFPLPSGYSVMTTTAAGQTTVRDVGVPEPNSIIYTDSPPEAVAAATPFAARRTDASGGLRMAGYVTLAIALSLFAIVVTMRVSRSSP